MDTKLKKSHKLTTIIITLCILVSSFFITSLYPKIGTEMQKLKAEYEEQCDSYEDDLFDWELQDNFVNYAIEASYHIYGEMLMQATGQSVDFSVLDYAGWTRDYYYLDDQVRYHATYEYGDGTMGTTNSTEGMETEDTIAKLTLAYDMAGNLSTVNFEGDDFYGVENLSLRNRAEQSIAQYKDNVAAYQSNENVNIDVNQLLPKNFTIEFLIDPQCDFVWESEAGIHSISTESLLFDVGVIWIMLIAISFIAIVALVLPFFKKLETGWETIFCAPFEIIFLLGVGAVFGFIGMFYAMGETCMIIEYPKLEIIGTMISSNIQYGVLLALNLLGWAACFILEYIVITSIYQFLCRPIYYLKNRFLFIIVLRWLVKGCKKLYKYVTDINITEKLHSSILKIVIVNFVILTVLCTLWLFGIAGLVVYSIGLYILLRKYGEKIQKQYNSVLNATNQMAEGNLKIEMEDDLGVFKPIGDSLEKIQQGFQKAVVEESKSQNMKTELITNVSHDLKTPLTSIITYVDLLKKEDITEEERKGYIDTLEKKSQRLKVLIEDLFEVSKAHSGNVQMNFMEVDVVSLIKQVKSEMDDQIEASNLTFRWNLPEEKIILSLDGQRTYRVFENLLGNALKYAMPYSRVYVDLLDLEQCVKVVFRNISAQEISYASWQLTERFVRGDASRNSEGSGLGLAIAKSFVELQNGKLHIEIDGDLFKVTITWNK